VYVESKKNVHATIAVAMLLLGKEMAPDVRIYSKYSCLEFLPWMIDSLFVALDTRLTRSLTSGTSSS
jgi:hypothetical protein